MEEKSNNKICGECRYFSEDGGYCIYWCDIKTNTEPCELFELPKKLTNGDRIRAMSDEELVMVIWKSLCGFCPHNGEGNYCNKMTAKTCIEVGLEWLKKEAKDEN